MRPAKTLSRVSRERRMILKREDKKVVLDSLKDKFSRAKGVVLAEYKGLTVAEVSELRDKCRAVGIEYRVVKNTLARIASEGTSIAPAMASFKGPIAIAISYDDAVTAVRETLEYAKKNEKFKVQCGVVDGTFCDASGIKRIADLPSRPVMLGIMAGTLQAPTTKMAQLLSATVTKFAFAMQALKDRRAAG